ncbi:MAG: DUF362 domain-containing protein [Desulfobacterales bacterium]|nr:DUF362 domain-containing protein [Desulfobacterales bacterium]MBF0396483.1 DUF362 domain-containing protein [Desulfobacterales bacterium]
MTIAIIKFKNYKDSIAEALNAISADKSLEKQTAILIKPNLVNDSPFPVTTHPDCCRAIIEYIKSCSKADIIVGEGCGDAFKETPDIYKNLGYNNMAGELGISLVDLNYGKLNQLRNPKLKIFPEMYLPEIAFNHYIISVPVLKAHSLSDITGTLKNMMGFAPPKYYSGKYGIWKKAVFHNNIHQAIKDLNSYRTPDLTVMDASVGLAEYHLGGAKCNPFVNKILAGFNPIEIDREAASLLGLDWRRIPHLF